MPRAERKRGVRGYQKKRALEIALEKARMEGRAPKTKHYQKDGVVRVGGARPGAGGPAVMPWARITAIVERTGCDIEEILALPSIPAKCLDDPTVIERLREVVERGQRLFRLSVREALADKGVKALSVTALLGIARNTRGLDYDQPSAVIANAPDVAGIEGKIDELLAKLARKAGAQTSDLEALRKENAALRAKVEELSTAAANWFTTYGNSKGPAADGAES